MQPSPAATGSPATRSSGAYGIPQALPPRQDAVRRAGRRQIATPAAQIAWASTTSRPVRHTRSTRGRTGRGHGYAQGGLVPGYASGGTVGSQGAAYLKAWQTRHGGGFGAAWGPVVLNQQIAADGRRGAPRAGPRRRGRAVPGQHRFWAAAAPDEKKRLGVLRQGADHRAGVAHPAGRERARPRQGDPRGGEPPVAGRARQGVESADGPGQGHRRGRSARCSATPTRTWPRTRRPRRSRPGPVLQVDPHLRRRRSEQPRDRSGCGAGAVHRRGPRRHGRGLRGDAAGPGSTPCGTTPAGRSPWCARGSGGPADRIEVASAGTASTRSCSSG